MKEGRDLATTLITSTFLRLGASYVTQCSAAPHRPSPRTWASAGTNASGGKLERQETGDHEDRDKIERIGRALQTLGANPELRKTYGLPR